MPVYTYRCGNCGVQFERQQSFTDQPLKTCPECRKKALKKVITTTKVIFKGSGFYATDNRAPAGDASKKKSEKSEVQSEVQSEVKSEKKETKTESKTSTESSSE